MKNLLNDFEVFPEGTELIVESQTFSDNDGLINIDVLRQDTVGNVLGTSTTRLIKVEPTSFGPNTFQATFISGIPTGEWMIFAVSDEPAISTNGALGVPDSSLPVDDDFVSVDEIIVTVVDVLARLEQKKDALESCQIGIEKAIGIHKAAIQNAVDIVQTRRIEMNEHGEKTEVEGAVALALFTALLEFNVISMLGSRIIGGVTRALVNTRLQHSRGVRLERLGRLLENRDVFIKELRDRNFRLNQLTKRRDLAVAEVKKRAFSGRKKKRVVRAQLKGIEDQINQVKKEKISKIFPLDNKSQKSQVKQLVKDNNEEITRLNTPGKKQELVSGLAFCLSPQ